MKSDKKIYTIKDIAQKACVSSATVSNALNNKGRLNIATKQKILNISKMLGYEPNIVAKALSMKKSKVIGVFITDITNEYYAQVLEGIEDLANKNGYIVVLVNTHNDLKKEQKEVETLTRLFTEGLIFISGLSKFKHIIDSNSGAIPIVCIDREVEEKIVIPSVLINNTDAMVQAVNYLYKMGHREIGYFGSMIEKKDLVIKKRYEGYQKGIEMLGLNISQTNIFNHNLSQQMNISDIYKTFTNYIKNNLKRINATALISQNDNLAIALMQALKDCGIRVPEEISVMGFDNIFMAQFVNPPLTTTEQPKKELGKVGVQLLLDIINNKRIDNKVRYLKTNIIERKSVIALKK